MLDTSGGTNDVVDAEQAAAHRHEEARSRGTARARGAAGARGLDGPADAEAGEVIAVDKRLRGYAKFYEYMERELGYAPHTARERLRVSRALRQLPATTLQLAKGELAYSHVRELTRVATAETEAAWLAATVDRNTTQVQELVAG